MSARFNSIGRVVVALSVGLAGLWLGQRALAEEMDGQNVVRKRDAVERSD